MSTTIIQIITAILGTVGTIAVAVINKWDVLFSKEGGAQRQNPAETNAKGNGSSSPARDRGRGLRPRRSYLDLASYLVCAAFFSALLTDSIVIAGREPSLSLILFFETFLITGMTTAAFATAWYLHRGELILGVLSVGTLFVLFLSPGVPPEPSGGSVGITVAQRAKESGISLFLPVLVLTFLASMSAIYYLGNFSPQAKVRGDESRSVGLWFVLVGLTSVGSLMLAWQNRVEVLADDRAPRFEGKPEEIAAANSLLEKLLERTLAERGMVYQLGSEMALNGMYRSKYFEVVEALRLSADLADVKGSSDLTSNEVAGPKASDGEAEKVAAPSDTQSNRRTTVASSESNKLTAQILRSQILQAVGAYVERLGRAQLLDYLKERLGDVHPAVTGSNTPLDIKIPGVSPETRLINLSEKHRSPFWGTTSPRFRGRSYVRTFPFSGLFESSFEETAISYESPPPSPVSPSDEDPELREYKRVARNFLVSKDNKYLPLRSSAFSNFVRLQLSLRLDDEVYLAYSEYRRSAPSTQDPKLVEAWEKFAKLNPKFQNAFITYVAQDRSKSDERYKTLLPLATRNGKSGTELRVPSIPDSATAPIDLANLLTPPTEGQVKIKRRPAPELEVAANYIGERLTTVTLKNDFISLLTNTDPAIPLGDLLNADVFELLEFIRDGLDDNPDRPDSRAKFLALLTDPVTPTIMQIAQNSSPYKEAYGVWLGDRIKDFKNLTSSNREQLLLHLAIGNFRSAGEFSFDPFSLLILQSNNLSSFLSYLCAAMMNFPFVVAATVLGAYSSRKLVERDRTRDLLAAEIGSNSGESFILGEPVELLGREPFIDRLGKLSGKGWSTIALVGRRGVGKSRILHELSKPGSKSGRRFAISVWLSSPTQSNESDFLETSLEQLAVRTELAISDRLQALPYVVRSIEARTARNYIFVMLSSLVVLLIILSNMYERLLRPEIMVTWLPIACAALVGVFFYFLYVLRLQPVDLSPWLERDRDQNPHTVLLYRRAQQALIFLQNRRKEIRSSGKRGRSLAMWILLSLVGCYVGFLLLYRMARGPDEFVLYAALLTTSIVAIYGAFSNSSLGSSVGARSEVSVMALITEYREFAMEIVQRLGKGALSPTREIDTSADEADLDSAGSRVLVCIDELDKIISIREVRLFLKRMKAVFELPGFFYYLSLSEDAMSQLYLGPAEGKNEIDSSLDHAVRIPPLPLEFCKTLVERYLAGKITKEAVKAQVEQRVIEILAVSSFGIPRDAIRRCDEFLANSEDHAENWNVVLSRIVSDQFAIIAETFAWPKDRSEVSKKPITEITKFVTEMLDQELPERERRAIALLLIQCLIGSTIDWNGGPMENGKTPTDVLYDLGYRLPFGKVPDLLLELRDLRQLLGLEIVSRIPTVSADDLGIVSTDDLLSGSLFI